MACYASELSLGSCYIEPIEPSRCLPEAIPEEAFFFTKAISEDFVFYSVKRFISMEGKIVL